MNVRCIPALLAMVGSIQAAEGLSAPSGEAFWPRWQARIAAVNSAPLSRFSLAGEGRQTGLLLGDYFFRTPAFGLGSGVGAFRASTGFLFATRGATSGLAAPEISSEGPTTGPYVGIGYSGLSIKGGWRISADIGLVAENPAGALRLGRALFGNQGWDGGLREVRLSPVLQLGVRYAF